MSRILIIEDDRDIQELIKLSLSNQGIKSIDCASEIDKAKEMIEQTHYQVILLDLNLNSEDGYQLIKYVNLNETAIIVVTAKNTSIDVYRGFENGAVDYIKKPFDPMELYYRVALHLNNDKTSYCYKNLKIDFNSTEVKVKDKTINLTSREYDLLLFLINNKNQVLSKDQIYEKVWGFHTSVDDNTLMVHIRTLRKKIESDANHPQLIKTVRGKGYMYKEVKDE
ncbi:response regulator transcription factor [Staphylococcus caprae]|uniref:response regulator transcription factor n=1 Tax=Staphylococcus caprae TaxID=29380 RepID=UPI003B212F4B